MAIGQYNKANISIVLKSLLSSYMLPPILHTNSSIVGVGKERRTLVDPW